MPRGIYERKPRARKPRPDLLCIAPECDRIATRRRVQLCERHYYRKRAHGSFDNPRVARPTYSDAHGYVYERCVGHPLAMKSGYVAQHRLVFYRHNGAGPFKCHWCGVDVAWRGMHVDHLNSVPSDNQPENLVASCPPCNQGRARPKAAATNRAKGLNLTLRGETLPIALWAERLGIRSGSLKARLRKGWSLEHALTTPRGKFGPEQRA